MSYKNCLDYLDHWGAASLTEAPFCELDSLILSVMAYGQFERVLPPGDSGETLPFREAVDRLTTLPGWDHTGVVMADRIPQLILRAAESPRFRDLPIGRMQSVIAQETGTQFAAMTWFLPDGTLYLAYRGTDDTLVGWKECFTMAYAFPIPAQKLAEDYLTDLAARHPGKLRLGGHSKGGNLAVWAAVNADAITRGRILRVDSHDGPGFTRDLTGTPAYRALGHRIHVYVPQSSLVGALLHQDPYCQIIRSHGSGTVGQHDPFTWEVQVGATDRERAYRPAPRRSLRGQKSAEVVRAWLTTMRGTELESFVEIVFGLLSAGKARTLTDLTTDPIDNALSALRAFQTLDPETRRELGVYLKRLVGSL